MIILIGRGPVRVCVCYLEIRRVAFAVSAAVVSAQKAIDWIIPCRAVAAAGKSDPFN